MDLTMYAELRSLVSNIDMRECVMELFLRIFKATLLGYVFILGLAISFVAGGLVAGCCDIPEQPDYRIVLDKITPDMSIQELQHLLDECFNCSMEINSKNDDFSNGIWVAPGYDRHSWQRCLVADSQGYFWDHKYIFFFGIDDRLMGISEHFPTSRLQYPPWPWKWRPTFAMSHASSPMDEAERQNNR